VDIMKYLNKNYPDSVLNNKIRILYSQKQEINNSKLSQDEKFAKMKEIDKQINKLWRESNIEDLKGVN